MASSCDGINTLNTEVLLMIFSKLSAPDRSKLPYVCKSWAVWLKSSGELYNRMLIDLSQAPRPEHPQNDQFLLWMRPRIGFTDHLSLKLPSDPPAEAASSAADELLSLCSRFQRLRHLVITNDGRFWCPGQLECLPFLRSLQLKANTTFFPLPESLGQLKALESLDIEMEVTGGQRVSASFLPIDLLSMLQLERLSLSRCGILTLPLALYQLDRMQHLCIRNCRKVFFAEGAYMATTFIASHLESLTLAYCDMHILPAQVGALSNLVKLDLEGNNMTSLPGIGFPNLRHLCLAHNNFAKLPRILFRLPNLQTLDLSHNPRLEVSETEHSSHTRDDMLYSLSTLVGRLENLEVLNLEQSPRKEWSALSKYQLRLLLLQLQWRQEKPGKGPLGALKHLNINPFVTGEQAVFSHLSDPGYP